MKTPPERIASSKHSIIIVVVQQLSIEHSMTKEMAFRKFLGTKTYTLLMQDKSYLWTESPEYVYDMFKSEMSNDWTEWLKL